MSEPVAPVNGGPAEMVRQFHEVYGLPDRDTPQGTIPETDLRIKLILEEAKEYMESAYEGDIVGIAQELADIIYVTYGAALCHGIDLDAVIAEVHRANLSKLGLDGKPMYREDGKVLKGPNYTKPDVKKVLFG